MTSFLEVVSEEYFPVDQPKRIGRYKLDAVIGQGKSSTVRKATREGDQKLFAVKVLNKLAGHEGTLIHLQYQQEVESLRKMSHSHVITMHDCLQTSRRYYIVLDLLPGVLLSAYVAKRCGLLESEAQWLSSQLTSALACLHTGHVVHRDLKPSNVIIDTQIMKVTLIDFGLSSSVPGRMIRRCGTPAYMAPEVTSSIGYNCAVDMWSLGVSIVEMLMGSPPKLKVLHNSGNYQKLVQRSELFASLPTLSKDCVNFLDRLLQIHPEQRITSSEALQHSWITEAKDITASRQ